MRKWYALATVMFLAGCAGSDGRNGTDGSNGEDGTSCTIESTAGGNTVVCSDGTSAALPGAAPGSVVATTDEAAGTNCEFGGVRVDHGLDDNFDGVLDAEEIDGTTYVCDGATGQTGADGAPGLDGEDGVDGVDGVDGTDALQPIVTVTDEAAGTNCQFGGVRVDVGLDTDASGVLDASEITGTEYVCNGVPGPIGPAGENGYSSLVLTSYEAPGTNCLNGGTQIDSGLDLNRDNVLDASEITNTSYVCVGGMMQCDPATEVAYNGRCYYLDGTQGVCQTGDVLAPQSVLDVIADDFIGKTYKTVMSQNCCIMHADQAAEGQDWGFEAMCNAPGPFTEAPSLGAAGCTDQQNNYAGQLTLCMTN